MSVWLDAARITAGVNLLVLLVLGSVWTRNYLRYGARHTLGLLVFAAFLVVENTLWLYFYVLHPDFVSWFRASGSEIQIGLTLLCGLELVALAVLVRITWQ